MIYKSVYKAIISDYDYTLTTSNHTVSPDTVFAIDEFISHGGHFAVCSGRMSGSVIAATRKNKVNGLIAGFNGGEILNPVTGEIYFKKSLSNNLCVSLLEFIEKENLYVQAYSDKIIVSKANDYTESYAVTSSTTITETIIPLWQYFKENNFTSGKILIKDEKEKLDAVYGKLFAKFSSVATVVRSSPEMIDVTAKGINKATACEWLIEIWNIKREELIAVGDAGNDRDMIAYAGLGVAVANAEEDIKAIAAYIAPDCNSDPIKHLIEKFCL